MQRPRHTLLLTTSYPAFRGDFSGHFVATRAHECARDAAVTVAAAGQGDSTPEASGVYVEWLGGKELFAYPGALERLREKPLRILWLPPVLWRAWLAMRRLEGPIEAHWLVPFGMLATLIGRARRGPLHVVAHGSDVRLLCRAPNLLRASLVYALRRAGAQITFVSEELRAELARGLPAKLEAYVHSAKVAPAALDFDGAPESQADARRLLGIPDGRTLVVVVGRLVEGKRPEVALNAADLLADADVVCIGDGPLRDSLERQFPAARFLGSVPRELALRWICAADLLFQASRLEGAPTAVREALNFGTDVVSVPAGDLTAWARQHPGLFLVASGATGAARVELHANRARRGA